MTFLVHSTQLDIIVTALPQKSVSSYSIYMSHIFSLPFKRKWNARHKSYFMVRYDIMYVTYYLSSSLKLIDN